MNDYSFPLYCSTIGAIQKIRDTFFDTFLTPPPQWDQIGNCVQAAKKVFFLIINSNTSTSGHFKGQLCHLYPHKSVLKLI